MLGRIRYRTLISLLIISASIFGTVFYLYLKSVPGKPDAKGETDVIDTIIRSGSIPYMSNEELSMMSSVIVQGSVESMSIPRWNTDDGQEPDIVTQDDTICVDNEIKITNVLKGDAERNSTLKVRTFGGECPQYKNIRKIVCDMYGKFVLNENVVIFLVNDDSNYNKKNDKGYYVLKGMTQGLFTIDGDNIQGAHGEMLQNDFFNTVDRFKNLKPTILAPKYK
jgi:hypothetical protein